MNTQLDGFTLSFLATELEAREGICAVAAELGRRGVSEERAGDVEIALAEAINNIVEHAYAGLTAGQVFVHCHLRENCLDIRIADTGHPMPGGQLPVGIPASVETELSDLPEGGFGWFLIRQFTSDIRYERAQGYNRLSLRFDIPHAQ